MRKLLSNNLIMLAAPVVLVIIGVAVSICSQDFTWFARFGSIITGIGIIILTRPSITGKDIMVGVVMDETGLTQLDPEYYRRRNEQIPDWLLEDRRSRNAVGIFGPLVTLVGTLIWGFADLLNIPFGFRHQNGP